MLTAFCLSLIILTVVSFSIVFEARLSIDVYSKNNYISVLLFGINIIKLDISVFDDMTYGKTLQIKHGEKTLLSINIGKDFKSDLNKMFKNDFNPLLNLNIVRILLYGEYGDGDPLRTAIIVGCIKNSLDILLNNFLFAQKSKIYSIINPNFNGYSTNFVINGIFSITLADIIYSNFFIKKER